MTTQQEAQAPDTHELIEAILDAVNGNELTSDDICDIVRANAEELERRYLAGQL